MFRMIDRKQKVYEQCKQALCITGLALSVGICAGVCGCGPDREPGGMQEPAVGTEETDSPAEHFEPEWKMNVMEEELVLEDFSEELDILFLTDSHAVVPDDETSEQEAEYSAGRYGIFCSGEGIPSFQMLHDWISYANAEDVDAVLLGGDIIDHPSGANLDYLNKELHRLNMPYLYVIGNHDWTFPWEYMSEAGKEAYLPLLEPYMDDNTAIHTWETEELLVIAVDNSSGQVNPAALEEYKRLLETEKAIILLLHVPFSTETLSVKAREVWNSSVVIGDREGDIEANDCTRQFMELTTAKDSPVELVLAGHVHFYDRNSTDGEKPVLQIVGDAAFHGSAVRLRVRE